MAVGKSPQLDLVRPIFSVERRRCRSSFRHLFDPPPRHHARRILAQRLPYAWHTYPGLARTRAGPRRGFGLDSSFSRQDSDRTPTPMRAAIVRGLPGGNVRKRVNEKGRCNLRFAKRTSGAINARTEGDTACEEEEHRVGRGVKPDLGDAGSLRPAEHAAAPAADVGGRGGRRVGPRSV